MTTQRQAQKALNRQRRADEAPLIANGELLPTVRLGRLQNDVARLVERLERLDVALYRGGVGMLVGMDPEVSKRIDQARLDLLSAQLDGLQEHMTRMEAQLTRLLEAQ